MPPEIPTEPLSQGMGRLEGRLDSTLNELKRVAGQLSGNGQPGVLERLTRTEETVKKTAENVDSLASTLGEIKDGLEHLLQIVEKHHADKDLHSYRIFFKKDILLWLLILLVLFHTILEEGGPILDRILKLLGI